MLVAVAPVNFGNRDQPDFVSSFCVSGAPLCLPTLLAWGRRPPQHSPLSAAATPGLTETGASGPSCTSSGASCVSSPKVRPLARRSSHQACVRKQETTRQAKFRFAFSFRAIVGPGTPDIHSMISQVSFPRDPPNLKAHCTNNPRCSVCISLLPSNVFVLPTRQGR